MNPPFPFIVGCGRSGSTLLRLMLDAHPDFAMPRESYFLEQLVRRRDGFTDYGGTFDRAAFEAELFADPRFRTWGLDPVLVVAELDEHPPRDLAASVRCVYRSFARTAGATRWGDKTPSYSLCIPDLARLLPEAVFVHLVRDPRDVAASYRNTTWGPRTMTSAGRAWTTRVGAIERGARSLDPSRLLEVRYESLVADPVAELQRVCDFVGLTFDPVMLDYADSGSSREVAATDSGAHRGVLQPPTIGIRDWRRDLTPAEAARVGAVTDRRAATFGYPPSPPCRGINRVRYTAERLGAAIEVLSLRFRRTRFANRLRGPWRRLRRRATPEQLGLSTAVVSAHGRT